MSKIGYQIKCLTDYMKLCIETGTAVWPVIDAMREAIEMMQIKNEGRLVELPAPIGVPVYVIYPQKTDVDGSVIPAGVEELHLSGYVNEDGREFYLTYSECDTSCCDVPPYNLFVTREAAEAALKEREEK